MKKIFLYSTAIVLALSSCRKDDETATYTEPEDIAVQNSYDDQAIQKFLDTNYLDNLGNIKAFSSTDTSDDNNKKLSELNPVTLPSGVVYIVRNGAQPNPGTTIGVSDSIRLMSRTYTSVATNTDNNITFSGTALFRSTIDGTGVPEVDPKYYYIDDEGTTKDPLIENATTDAAKLASYYEIEGFREGLQHFKAFNMEDSDNYNLQGVIIVPSRAAFARDPHYNYAGYSLRNRSFIFNFQVYKTIPRP